MTSVGRFASKLHFLLHDEPHPDLVVDFDENIRWMPRAYSSQVRRLFHHRTAHLTSYQRLLCKLALKMPIDFEEATWLQKRFEMGLYKADRDPKVFLFCLARASGKTEIACRLAEICSAVGPTCLLVPNSEIELWVEERLGSSAVPDNLDLRVFNLEMAKVDYEFIIFDELLLSGHYHLSYMNADRYTTFVSLFSSRPSMTINTGQVPTMALSASIRDMGRFDSYTNYASASFSRPPISEVVCHEFNTG